MRKKRSVIKVTARVGNIKRPSKFLLFLTNSLIMLNSINIIEYYVILLTTFNKFDFRKCRRLLSIFQWKLFGFYDILVNKKTIKIFSL